MLHLTIVMRHAVLQVWQHKCAAAYKMPILQNIQYACMVLKQASTPLVRLSN